MTMILSLVLSGFLVLFHCVLCISVSIQDVFVSLFEEYVEAKTATETKGPSTRRGKWKAGSTAGLAISGFLFSSDNNNLICNAKRQTSANIQYVMV